MLNATAIKILSSRCAKSPTRNSISACSEESLVKSLQKRIEPDQPEEEVVELMVGEQQSWITANDEDEEDEGEGEEAVEGEAEGEVPAGEAAVEGVPGGSFEDTEIKD